MQNTGVVYNPFGTVFSASEASGVAKNSIIKPNKVVNTIECTKMIAKPSNVDI